MDMRVVCCFFFFFKQKTAYEMRISDWSSDVCSSDLLRARQRDRGRVARAPERGAEGAARAVGVLRLVLAVPSVRAGRPTGRRPVRLDRKSVVSGKSV